MMELNGNINTNVERNSESRRFNSTFCQYTIKLGDIIHTSTLDWPGKVVMIIFTRTCPFECVYCSNSKLLSDDEKSNEGNEHSVSFILDEIEKSKRFIDGVILSGGEPLEQDVQAIKEIAEYVKNSNLLFGIQTNGIYPNKIKELADFNLIDAVFLDIKAPLENKEYSLVINRLKDIDNTVKSIYQSLNICSNLKKQNKLAYFEVRTTIFRDISDKADEIEKISKTVECCDAYVLQQGRPEVALDEKLKRCDAISRDELINLARVAHNNKSPCVKVIKIRTHAFGDEIIR
jgi:pyruvate formate lyase activating enzyme